VAVLIGAACYGQVPLFRGKASLAGIPDYFRFQYGDMNGDGKIDAVSCVTTTGRIGVHDGNGKGAFAKPRLFPAQVGQGSYLALADMNGDGNLDVVTHSVTNNSVSILLGDGHGQLASAFTLSLGMTPDRVAVGDVNGDGFIDIVTSHYSAGSISLLVGDGQGGVASVQTVPSGTGPYRVAVADFNSDGLADVACADSYATAARVFLGSSTGLQAPPTTIVIGSDTAGLALGDVNGDGKPDLATLGRIPTALNTISVALGNGDGTFAPTIYTVLTPGGGGIGFSELVITDFDGNGIQDYVTADEGGFSVFNGDGNGGYTLRVKHAVAMYGSLDFVDVNQDGVLDMLSGGQWDLYPVLGAAPGLLTNHTLLNTFYGVKAVTVADMNLDGANDIVLATDNIQYKVLVALNNGVGGFVVTPYPTAGLISNIVASDTNLDGYPDIVVSTSGNGHLASAAVLRNDGLGGLTAPTYLDQGWSSTVVRVHDMNLDGLPDVLRAYLYFPGQSGGTFGGPVDFAGLGGPDLAIADLNEDTRPDVMLPSYDHDGVYLSIANGAGGYFPPQLIPVGDGAGCVAVGDWNLDGHQDIAVGNKLSHDISILLGTGLGTFVVHDTIEGYSTPGALVVGDLNQDSVPDIVVASGGTGAPGGVVVLVGTGSGTFLRTVYSMLECGFGTRSIAIADMNADGRPDLVCSAENPRGACVMLNEAEHPAPVTLCAGDGSGAACPCANTGSAGRGCGNSLARSGAKLLLSGRTSIANDTLTFESMGQPNGLGLYVRGDAMLGGGSGVAFGSGVLCVGGSLIRLVVSPTQDGISMYPTLFSAQESVPVSVRSGATPGSVHAYQYWYRDVASPCSGLTSNLTNAVMIAWSP
jgi:hypothetical protein